ncbi:hypothetical protein ACI65C_006887 [Semiaphis heraclei]
MLEMRSVTSEVVSEPGARAQEPAAANCAVSPLFLVREGVRVRFLGVYVRVARRAVRRCSMILADRPDEEIIRLLEQSSSGSEDEESDVDIEKMIFYEKYKDFISEDLLTENMFEEATSTELKHTTWTDDRNLLIIENQSQVSPQPSTSQHTDSNLTLDVQNSSFINIDSNFSMCDKTFIEPKYLLQKSLISAKSFADKATIISDLSGDDDKSKRKLLAKKKTQSYSDCPGYPESEDEVLFSKPLTLKRSAEAGWSPLKKKKVIIYLNYSEDEVFNETLSLKKSAGWSPSPKKKKVQLINSSSINSIKRSTTSIGASIQRPSIVKKLSYNNESPIKSGKGIMIPKMHRIYFYIFYALSTLMVIIMNIIIRLVVTSNNNDNPNSLRSAEIKYTNNKSPQIIIATPTSRSSVETSDSHVTPTELGKDFQKEVLHTLFFIKHELRRIVNNQRDLTQRFDIMEIILEKMQSASDFSVATNNSSIPITDVTSSYSLPLDNLQDLEIFEKHISEDGTFRNSLNINNISYITKTRHTIITYVYIFYHPKAWQQIRAHLNPNAVVLTVCEEKVSSLASLVSSKDDGG